MRLNLKIQLPLAIVFTSNKSFRSIFIASFLLFSFSLSLTAQDLIEQTRLGVKAESAVKVNEIAKFMAKKWKRSNARNGDYKLFEFNPQSPQTNLTEVVTDAVFLDIKPTDLNNLLNERPNQLSLAIPVDAKSSIALDLVEVDITTFDFEIVLSSGLEPPNLDNALFYRGIVRGNTDSWAAISVFEGKIMGVIADVYGNYVLGGLDKSNQYTFFNDHNFVENLPFECSFVDGELTATGGIRTSETESTGRNASTNCVKIYFEADHHSYGNLYSNADSVMNYVMGAFNALSTIYQNEQISIEMSGLKIWDTADSYGGTKGANCVLVLNNFLNAMNQNGFTGDLAHLITAINPNGGYSACGYAFSGCDCGSTLKPCKTQVFCNNFVPPVGCSQTLNTYNDFPTYSWTINVLAHEIGHNFGSPHTQACAWNGNNTAIDGCVPSEATLRVGPGCSTDTVYCATPAAVNPGTIMSYCHITTSIDLNSGFGTQPGNLIRSNYANANCLTACTVVSNDLGDGVCRTSMIITDSEIPGSTGNYRSASTIETDANPLTISASETVNFLSTSNITLKVGFHATANSNFTAKIESCTVPNLQSDNTNINTYLANIQTNETLDNLNNNDFKIVPNPANDQVNFTFDLTKNSEVSILIYDLSGQLMEVVQNRQLMQKGYNEVYYRLPTLKAGMFYTVMNIDGILSTKKMILVK